ncbi:MAG: glycosyltransferase family 4 protein [Alphaproteobacteria bacterium]|nr:glycosyltransferase family 4 protein [Alphaproteobacteria bacterium]
MIAERSPLAQLAVVDQGIVEEIIVTGEPKIFVWQWGRFGAGPRIAFELARMLQRHCGNDVILSLAENAELLDSPMCKEAVRVPLKAYVTATQFATRTVLIRKILRPLLRELERERPNVALCVMPGYWDTFLVRHLRRIGIPVISIVHDATNHPGDHFQLINWLQRGTIKHSTAIITLTDFVARRLQTQKLLENKKHQTIPHPALIFPDLKLAPPQMPQYPRRKPLRLLLTGRLQKYKGVELFLSAISRINAARLSVRIAGSLNDQTLLAQVKDMPHVEIVEGWMSEKEFVSHIDWSDVVVLPYTEASQSGIIPTAYLRRRPVIATPVGGLPEQVRHEATGLLTDNVSPEAIAQAILRFLDTQELLKSCADNAYTYARNELNWERFGLSFWDICSEITQRE